jgi:penicillin-binding protein 1B
MTWGLNLLSRLSRLPPLLRHLPGFGVRVSELPSSPMARRPRGSSRRRTRAPRPKRRWLFRVALYGTLGGLIVTVAYAAYLDFTVRTQFEGKRWAVPARVYARPLELYQGMSLGPDLFATELQVLRYREVSGSPSSPGSYRRSGGEFRLVTRPFTFLDGQETAVAVRAVFRDGRLAALERADDGRVLDLVRLDPALIGGIYPAHNEDRILVQLAEVPPRLIDALIAVEDRRFHEHHGVAPRAIARAMLVNLRAGSTVQGGSTLTQQLVKNFYLSNERTLGRKLNEAIMAVLLDWHYEKGEILEAYLNEVYLGQDGQRAIHGFGLASQFYFEQPIGELKLHQAALLVALVRGPSYYDPRRNPERAQRRRDLVLDLLVEQGVVGAAEARLAKDQPLGVARRAPSGVTPYPAFLDLVRRQLRRDYRDEDLTSEGLRIFTTLDPLVQRSAEAATATRVGALERRQGLPAGKLEAAAVVASTAGGEVLAVVGGREPGFAGFNRALDAARPVGSLVKPAVFLAALSRPQHYTLATLVDDGPLSVRMSDGSTWTPSNFDRQHHGAVPVYTALANSYNLSTARIGLSVGLPEVMHTLRRMGVARELNPYPSLLLGATALPPIEVAQMYQSLASGGFHTPLRAIRGVLTADGQPLSRYPLTVQQGFDPAPVYLVNTALQKAVEEGTGRSLAAAFPGLGIAGKTGTTDGFRDSWFAGFTGDLLAVVWMGADDNTPTGLTGASGALQVWSELMRPLAPKPLRLVRPANVELTWVDPALALRTDAACTPAVELPFISGTAPQGVTPCAAGRRETHGVGDAVEKTIDWIRGIFR